MSDMGAVDPPIDGDPPMIKGFNVLPLEGGFCHWRQLEVHSLTKSALCDRWRVDRRVAKNTLWKATVAVWSL